jgi:hypothetical protein
VVTAVALLAVLAVAACGGGTHEPAQVELARAFLHKTFGGTERCSDAGHGATKCRVIALKGDFGGPLNCRVPKVPQWRCHGSAHATRAELAYMRRHAPHATAVIHVVSVSRMTVPRSVVASGEGFSSPPFRLPLAYANRSRLHGKGPSLYLTINRDQYEDDLVTDTGNEARVRIYRRSGRLLSDWAWDSDRTRYWDATTRVLQVDHSKIPSYFEGARDPLTAFEKARRGGSLRAAGRRRYKSRFETWTVDANGLPKTYHSRSQHHVIDVRFKKLERLPLTPELKRQLRIGKHPTSRVIHTAT